ncbi:MAG TPA: Lrp/AsnC family transcriptional regulator [Desulfitobacteriaceae bacterium]|nr:Lrp/AsnC family transcriptional regulator [Desulfitobacteriaceae bacterium]
MEQIDGLLLNMIQSSFPTVRRPYEALAESIGVKEKDVLNRIEDLRDRGIIRRIGGVFDSRKLGYYSSLFAAKVPENKTTLMADILEKVPGVTHNYLRTHTYNMWFTLIVSSQNDVDLFLHDIREKSGISEIYSLPYIRMFKIKVDFDFSEDRGLLNIPQPDRKSVEIASLGPKTTEKLTILEIELVKRIQEDLPSGLRPYDKLADDLRWTEEQVMKEIRRLQAEGIIRRFGAVLNNRKAGFQANAMGVWPVDENRIEEVGLLMAGFKQISHCYQRPTMPDWPYNLFTMVHGHTAKECEDIIREVAYVTGINEFEILFSTAELKKTSMKYFLE